ncbi:MAG: IPT/TIG domain-containing protein, partial [Myxococcota bacterium]|nr:IPT/TIG domain-containing protein [Myxococcota bacterium]
AGFSYDGFVVSPNAGATTGGTRIALMGSGTHWTSGSWVAVGGQPCTSLAFTDATHLACTTPPGAAGSKDVAVTNADATLDQARDAFTYSDSADGYRGGLYGGALSGNLRVLAFDSLTGVPLTGGKAIAGSSIATALIGILDSSGVAQLSGPSLTGKVTVTVAAKCHQPVTFVDVPVDSVTAYLAPELDASCQGDPPSTGNWYPTRLGEIDGELVWVGGIEFERAPWKNVPTPTGNEQRVAYVWAATGNPLDAFQLPSPGSATTPASDGVRGYAYATATLPGNQTIYALAGLEDRSVNPPRFEPYVMGIVRGVLVQPASKTTSVDIPMTTLLDHALSIRPQSPIATPRGPDRLLTTLAINVATGQFAILPQGTATTLMPVSGSVSFVGVPSLDGTLSGATYDLTAEAVSGPNGSPPLSVIKRIETTNANALVTLTGFPAIPALAQPSPGAWNGTHVALLASGAIDLVVVNIASGNGLLTWQIVAPGSSLSFDLPDLAQVPGVGTLSHGTISTTFSIARLIGFDYAQLRYGQLKPSAWTAYATDVATGSY